MIHLILKDGLGNQLFQYAFARYLQSIYLENGISEELVVNPFFLHSRKFEDNDKRVMSLQHLVLNKDIRFLTLEEQVASMKKFKLRAIKATPLLELYRWRFKKQKNDTLDLFNYRAKRGLYYTYSSYTEYKPIISSCNDKFVFGFFQTEKNFLPIEKIIKKEFLVKTAASIENNCLLEKIDSVNSVCLHIRRGDYLNSRWKNLQICNFEYYNNAINKILDSVDNPVFFVFSNTHEDILWIKENYNFYDLSGHRFIDLFYVDLSNPDYEELRLMMRCKNFIISNSTFSWWAAWLSHDPNKIVCAPDRWNLSLADDSVVYARNWIKIKAK